MPIGGERTVDRHVLGEGFDDHKLKQYAEYIHEVYNNIYDESRVDMFENPGKAYRKQTTLSSLENEFVKDFYDPALLECGLMTPKEADEITSDMRELFRNDAQAIREHSDLGAYNPVVGMAPFMHKNILMNMVWEEAITKVVAVKPSFSMDMYFRYLVKPDGTKIDMFTQQNEIGPAMAAINPWKYIELDLPELATTDIIAELGGGVIDDIAVDTYISAIFVKGVHIDEGEYLPNEQGVIDPETSKIATAEEVGEYDVWFNTELKFVPTYGMQDTRICMQNILIPMKTKQADGTIVPIEFRDTISATTTGGKFKISSMAGLITKVKLCTKLDTSNANYVTNKVTWSRDTKYVRIPNATGLSTTVSPQEIKDFAAEYGVNQMTEIIDIYNTVMSEDRDYKVKKFFDDDWKTINPRFKYKDKFDWQPPQNYAGDHITYRQATFMDRFEDFTTAMAQALNDPNIVFSVMADPRIVNKLTPTQFTYSAPSNIGPIEIDFTKTITTDNKKVYKWLGTDKLRDTDDCIVIPNSRNTQRIIYIFYEYQLYMSNEVKDYSNVVLPNIYAFDRYLIDKYQPLQGRMTILNRSGIANNPYVKSTGSANPGDPYPVHTL